MHLRGPKKHPLEYLEHFHWAVESEDSLIAEAVKRWGAERILFSTDHPHPDTPWPERKRVAVIGTGGLSHWVGLPETGRVNAEFDRWFLGCLVESRGAEMIAKYPRSEDLETDAGNSGQEIRDWLAVAAAMPAHLKPRVLAYEPMPGCGIGVMAWAMS